MTRCFYEEIIVTSNKSRRKIRLSEKPEWREVRKLPGRVFLTVSLPLLLMGLVSSAARDISSWLFWVSFVLYLVVKTLFLVIGIFVPWGPEEVFTAEIPRIVLRKR